MQPAGEGLAGVYGEAIEARVSDTRGQKPGCRFAHPGYVKSSSRSSIGVPCGVRSAA